MPEGQTGAARPVGRVRRISGIVLIVLGALLWADMAVIFTLFGSGFGLPEWFRFWFWLWVGTVLALTGSWLAYRSRAAGWAAALATVAGPLALFIRTYR